jgi:hypothetical protein
MSGERYEFDVFISYSHKDAKWVTDVLLPRLEKAGLKVCIDNRDFVAGEAAIVNMQDSIKNSRRILLVLTPNWVRSRWTKLEAEIAQITPTKDVENRIIPLMWKRCTIPAHLGRLTWVDFGEADQPSNDAWHQLLRSLGVPEEKIRQRERRTPRHSSNNKPSVQKSPRSLIYMAIVIAVMALFLLALINFHPTAKSLPTPTASIPSTINPTSTPSFALVDTDVSPTAAYTPSLPTDTPTITLTYTPTETPDPRCIRAMVWSPSSTDGSSPQLAGNCYDLTIWGISSLNNAYSFFMYGKSRAELYGFSESVQRDSSVGFNLKVNQLRDGEFWVGISETVDPQHDGIYIVALPNGKFHLRVYRDGKHTAETELDVPYGSNYQVSLKLEGARLTPVIYVYGAGTWTSPSQLIQFTDRRFYMGIRPLANGLVDASLTMSPANP